MNGSVGGVGDVCGVAAVGVVANKVDMGGSSLYPR